MQAHETITVRHGLMMVGQHFPSSEASQQGVSDQSIAKEYCRAKKQR